MAQKLKINDVVRVISGEHKNETAKIIGIDRAAGRAFLEGIEERERHVRKSYLNPVGGKKKVQLGIHLSNLKLEKAYVYEKPKDAKADKKAAKAEKKAGKAAAKTEKAEKAEKAAGAKAEKKAKKGAK